MLDKRSKKEQVDGNIVAEIREITGDNLQYISFLGSKHIKGRNFFRLEEKYR